MKRFALLSLLVATLATTLGVAPAVAGDPVAGKQNATACMACHGSESFGGIFYTLQLGGRDADKLVVKAMKYKTGKVLHPMMNVVTAFFSEKELEDIAAYYQSLGKPAFTSPFFTIKGDDEPNTVMAAASVPPSAATPVMAYPVSGTTHASPGKWTATY